MKIPKLFFVLLVVPFFGTPHLSLVSGINAEDRPLVTYDPTHTPRMKYQEYIALHPKAPVEVREVYRTQDFYKSLIQGTDVASKVKKLFVIVNSSLYSSITSSLTQYKTDLEAEGYTVNIYTWSGGTDVSLKTFIKDSSANLVGVLFVGKLPIAWYEMDNQPSPWDAYEDFPCDLYYMDLDGDWTDSNPTGTCQTGIWDGHSNGSGDCAPEIFVGRLYVSPSMGTEATLITKYFTKAHKYRTGGFSSQITDRALEYTDDDWSSGFNWSTSSAYDSVVAITAPSVTTAADYRDNRLTENYAWINLACHSNATTHYFGPGGSGQGTVNYNDIKNKKPLSHFYSLYCCSNCRFIESNCQGNWYVLVDSCGLGATGSCKTGGMYNPSTLFYSLRDHKTHGKALQDWWTSQLPCSESEKRYFYGLTLLGDPALVPRPGGVSDFTAPTNVGCSAPANSSIGVSVTPTLYALTASDPSTPVEYTFQLATNGSFTTGVQTSSWQSSTSWAPTTLSSTTPYYWRVKARDSEYNESQYCGNADVSGYWSFTTSGSSSGTLEEAVDNTSLTWTTGGNANWFYQTTTTHDAIDAAQSGDINDSQNSYFQAAVTGPGTLTFWWKVSSESNYDKLRFYDGTTEKDVISGDQAWAQKSYSITSGSHILKWDYTKDASQSTGSDCGWVDQIVWTPTGSNNAPTLSWTGETNYTSDGLHPETGGISDNYIYRIQYTDADNDAPNYVRVNILKGGSPISGSPFTMSKVNSGDNTYTDGCLYTYTKAGLSVGTDYTYTFDAQDSKGANATQTTSKDAPDVTGTNNTPTLSWTVETNYTSDGLHPETGGISDNYIYRIKYTDADNDAPNYVRVNILKGGSAINGSPFTMSKVTSGDNAYTDGCLYAYTKSGLATGTDYTYTFDAQDSKGANATQTTSKDAPDVTGASGTIGEAVDNTSLTWTTGGNANWFYQTTTTHDAMDAAQSGAITHSQNSYFQSTVTGPGTLTFWWKVSSESNYDKLRFYDGTTEKDVISGSPDWAQKSYSITSGSHILKWDYTKDASQSTGSDCGWVDQIVWTAGGTSDTAIVSITKSTVLVGSNNNKIYVNLNNPKPVAGVQIVITYDTLLSADSAKTTFRSSTMSISSSIGKDSIQVLLYGAKISTGTGAILEIPFNVSSYIQGDSTLLHIKKAVLSDTNAAPLPSYFVDTWLRLERDTTSKKSDVKKDGNIDILDVVRTVAIIQGQGAPPSSYELWAADVKVDGSVNIFDLLSIIKIIQGGKGDEQNTGDRIQETEYRIQNTGDTAEVTISRATGLAGTDSNIVYVHLNNPVGVAGIQIRITYDTLLTAREAVTTGRSGNMKINSSISSGKIQVLMYNMPLDTIASGSGSIIAIPFYISPNANDSILLHIDTLLLSDINIEDIPAKGTDNWLCLTVGTDETPESPKTFSLSYSPNPAEKATIIKYTIAEPSYTTLKIYDLSGKLVQTLVDEMFLNTAYYSVNWDGKDNQGNELLSGIYFIRLSCQRQIRTGGQAGDYKETKKLILVK